MNATFRSALMIPRSRERFCGVVTHRIALPRQGLACDRPHALRLPIILGAGDSPGTMILQRGSRHYWRLIKSFRDHVRDGFEGRPPLAVDLLVAVKES